MTGGPCRDCVSGTLSSEIPAGTETTIHSLPTYVARPDGEPKGLIVFVPDAFGWTLPNSRVLADNYAKKGGHLVYIPEFMDGHACPASLLELTDKVMAPTPIWKTIFVKPFYIIKQLSIFLPFMYLNRQAVCKPRIFNFFTALRQSPDTANMKIGVAGFCWGGQYVVKLCQNTPSSRVHRAGSETGQLQSLVDVGFTAHPSFVTSDDVVDVEIPLSIAIGDKDFVMPLKQVQQVQAVLEKKKAGDHEVVIYPGGQHGFAIRGNPADPKQKEAGDKAEVQALEWFGKWLA